MFTNPWLRRQETGAQRQKGGERPVCSKFHSRVGKVKIGRNPVTKELIFAKYIGAQNSSNEWITFDPFSADFNAWPVVEVAAAALGPNILQLAGTGEPCEVHAEEEGDEARIARLVQEARFKNLIQTMEIPVLTQQQNTQFAASLINPQPVEQLRLTTALPLKISTKDDGLKQLKRSRVDDSGAKMEVSDVDVVRTNIGSLAIGSQEVVMRDNCLFESDNVMAEPGHQARQRK